MSPSDLAFIGGAPRSGTTLLQAILSDADDTAPLLGEMRYLQHLLRAYAEVQVTWADDSRYFFGSLEEARRTFAEMTLKHFADVGMRYGTRRLVIKAPELTRYLGVVSELYPASLRLVMLRDPRDIVALQYEATEREAALGYAPSMLAGPVQVKGPLTGRRATVIRELARGVSASYAHLPRADWHLATYENLVRYPERALKQLAACTAWPIRFDPSAGWQPGAFSYLSESTTFQRAWHSPLWGKPISTERVGVHQTILRPNEVAMVGKECHEVITLWEAEAWS